MSLNVQLAMPLCPTDLQFAHHFTAPVTGLSGPSGVGKTTILRTIAGLITPPKARVTFHEEVWTDTTTKQHVPTNQRDLAYVMQEVALFPNLNVTENILFSQKTQRKKNQAPPSNYFNFLVERLGLEKLLTQPIQRLSGGQKQRVGLARALYSQPRLLLLDEPFNGLDEGTRAQAMTLTKELLNETQIPAIIVSHHQVELATLAQEIIQLTP
ncbi:ATP-binding cassette domain-containing protein [Enterococcus canis]|nr:ATP-binding cassette domain-containing protein [Enterococcus canis]